MSCPINIRRCLSLNIVIAWMKLQTVQRDSNLSCCRRACSIVISAITKWSRRVSLQAYIQHTDEHTTESVYFRITNRRGRRYTLLILQSVSFRCSSSRPPALCKTSRCYYRLLNQRKVRPDSDNPLPPTPPNHLTSLLAAIFPREFHGINKINYHW